MADRKTEDEEDFFHCLERFSIVDKENYLYKPEPKESYIYRVWGVDVRGKNEDKT